MDKLTRFEKIWLTVFLLIIVISSVWFSLTGTKWDDWRSVLLNWVITPISSVTGVICVVLSAKGKLSNWLWGLINSITYGFVAWVSGYYGDWILNWFFFIPTQVIIFFVWKSHLQCNSTIVKMRTLGKGKILLLCIGIIAVILFTILLVNVDNFFTESMKRNSAFYSNIEKVVRIPYIGQVFDSTTVIFQIVAEVLLIFMFAEQWPFWLATNIITIGIWLTIIVTDSSSYSYAIPTLLMWIAYLVNSIYGTLNWKKGSKC
jgi:nicotinamide mononucleotide transporter